MSQANEAIKNLTAQWITALKAALNLDDNFYLVQSNVPLGLTSEGLWRTLDAVPSATKVFNPDGHNQFSAEYGSIINNLKPQVPSTFNQILGDKLSDWDMARPELVMKHDGDLLAAFMEWANINLDSSKTTQAQTALQQSMNGDVPTAFRLWFGAGGPSSTKAYTVTRDEVDQKRQSASGNQVMFTSQQESSDVEKIFVEADFGITYDVFSLSASGSYDKLTEQFTSAGVEVSAKFDHVLTLNPGPLAMESSDAGLSDQKPWYHGSALDLAFKNNNNDVWNNTAPTWEDKFGDGGSLRRATSGLVIVDGIEITITSSASFSESEHQEIEAQAETGYWPFFQASGMGGWSHDVSRSDSGSITVTSTNKAGNPAILGAIVLPIEKFLG